MTMEVKDNYILFQMKLKYCRKVSVKPAFIN